jgi:DNA modification methylase
MISEHRIRFADAKKLSDVASQSVHLVVTSPPYPMIEMWDALFCRQTAIQKALYSQTGLNAFELMHRQLDQVWDELYRVLVPGGIACINIGDATRTINGEFALYPNHSRILTTCSSWALPTCPASCGASRPTRPTNSWDRA